MRVQEQQGRIVINTTRAVAKHVGKIVAFMWLNYRSTEFFRPEAASYRFFNFQGLISTMEYRDQHTEGDRRPSSGPKASLRCVAWKRTVR
jgi:hypothetical protein